MAEREWRPPWLMEQFFRLAPWGFPRQILMILAEGDKTFPEILEGFARFMHHFGHFGREEVVAGFTRVLHCNGGGGHRGTGTGRRGHPVWGGLQPHRRGLLHSQTVSLVGLGVHIVLAVLKLIVGAISGSIGLISDGLDMAMDGLSSVLVFVGLRLKKEQYVNVVLVLLMLGVWACAAYEAVHRVFVPEK